MDISVIIALFALVGSTIFNIISTSRAKKKDTKVNEEQLKANYKKEWEQEQTQKAMWKKIDKHEDNFIEINTVITTLTKSVNEVVQIVKENEKRRSDLIPLEMSKTRLLETVADKFDEDEKISEAKETMKKEYDNMVSKKK